MKELHVIRILSISSLCASILVGAPNISNAEKEIRVPKEAQQTPNNLLPQLPIEPLKESMVEEKGKQIFIKNFAVVGALHANVQALNAFLAPYKGKSYRFDELQKIASLVTKYYRDQGFFVARAYIPKQTMVESTLEIDVVEGNYGTFQVKNDSLVSDSLIQARLDAIKDDNIVSVDTLERAMLLINDTPGAKVIAADVRPGKNVGTSDFEITTKATTPYNAYIVSDNYGSKYTGRYRLNAGVSANSPFGYGDKFGMNGVISTTSDLKNGKIYYNFPLLPNGLRGELSVAKTTYSLAEEYEALDALGNATTFEGSLFYPMIRTREKTLNLILAYAHKEMKDEVRSTDTLTKKDSNALKLGVDYFQNDSLFGFASATSASLHVSRGDLDFKNADALLLDQAGARTSGTYSKIEGNLEKNILLNEDYSMIASLRFQKVLAHKNLDGSEDFSLGGAYGVRAFPDSEYSAENGYLLGLEFVRALPSIDNLTQNVSVFADTGYAKMSDPTDSNPSRQLSDVGLGYQVNYKTFFAKAQVARVIGGEKVESESPHDTKVLFQLGWTY